MIGDQNIAPTTNPIRRFVAVAIVFAVGFALQWKFVMPSQPIEQVQARIEAARVRPPPPLQPTPQVRPVAAREWTMQRDPFVASATTAAPSE